MFKQLTIFVFTTILIAGSGLSAGAVTLKLASITPEGSFWMTEMRKGAAEIKKRTEGRVVIKFYGGGVMGTEKSVLRKIRIGQLQGGAFTVSGLSSVCPDLRLLGLPLLFRSYDETDFVRASLDKKLIDALEKAGFISFGFAEGGFAYLMSHRPIQSLRDLKGVKIWIPAEDRISEISMKNLGLSPISLPITDVLTGLQTGLLDSVATPPVGAIAFQWHVRVKYLTDTPLAYTAATLALDKRAFNRLSPEDQATVREVMGGVYKHFDTQNRLDNQNAYQALLKHGIQSVSPTPQEIALWNKKMAAIYLKMKESRMFTPALFDEMQGMLSEYRNKNQAAN